MARMKQPTTDEPNGAATWQKCHDCGKQIIKGRHGVTGEKAGKWVWREKEGREVPLHYSCMTKAERDYVPDSHTYNARYAKTRAMYWKEYGKKRSKPPQKDPDLRMLGFWAPSDIHERVERSMKQHGFTTKSTWLNMAVQEQLNRDGC